MEVCMQATLITIILDVLLAMFILLGFLWGVARGVKKSTLRIALFLLFVGIAAIISGSVTSAVLNLQLTIDGNKIGISQYILDQILQNQEIKNIYDSSEAVKTLVQQLPVVILNVFVFWVLMIISKFVSWLLFVIISKIVFKNKKPLSKFGEKVYTVKDNQPVILTEVKENKHRFWGGLISACQALVFLFLLMLPFSGVVNLVNNLTTQTQSSSSSSSTSNDSTSNNQSQTTLSANNSYNFNSNTFTLNNEFNTINSLTHSNINSSFEYNSPSHLFVDNLNNNILQNSSSQTNVEFSPSSKEIRSIIGEEYLSYFQAYSKGIPSIIFGIGGFDSACFDSLTQTTINNEKIILSNELISFANTFDNIYYLLELDFTSPEFSYKTLDFNKLETAINSLFQSGIFRSIGCDILNYLIDDAIKSGKLDDQVYANELKELLQIVENSWKDENATNNLKNDLLASVTLMKVLCTSGLADIVIDNTSQNNQTEQIFELIKKDNGKLIDDALNGLFQSNTLKNVLVGALNIAIDNLETTLLDFINKNLSKDTQPLESVQLDKIKNSTINWNNLATDLKNILLSLAEIYSLSLENNGAQFSFATYDVPSYISQFANLANATSNAQFLQSTINGNNIYHQILNYLNKSQYSKYVDFELFKNISWNSDSQILIDFYNSIKPLLIYFESNSNNNTASSQLNNSENNSSNNQDNFSFKTFDYSLFNNTFDSLFNTNLVKVFKINILEEINTPSNSNSPKNILDNVINYLLENYNFVYETKTELKDIFSALKIAGESGAIDMIIENDNSYMSDAITYLSQTKIGETKNQLEIAIGHIFNTNSAKLLFVDLVNSWLESIEQTGENLGRVDKNLSWSGWNAFKFEMENISNNILNALNNVEKTDQSNILDDATLFINSKFTETSLYLGDVLDILATSNFLKYTNNQQTYSIYDNLIVKLFGDVFTLDEALSNNYTSDFWKTEFSNLAPALIRANELTIIHEGKEKTLLKAIFETNDIKYVLENSGLEDKDVELIFNALLNSKLFKGQVTDAINLINKELIQLVDPQYADELNGIADALQDENQKQDIVDVVNSAIKLSSLTNIEDINLETQGETLSTLLDTMQNNSNSEGIFKDAYNAITDFINSPSQNPTINAISEVINNPENNVGTDASNYNWAEIIRLANIKLGQ